jgi:hypothetical protein
VVNRDATSAAKDAACSGCSRWSITTRRATGAAVVKVNVEQPGSDTGAGAEHGRPGRQGGRQPIGAG